VKGFRREKIMLLNILPDFTNPNIWVSLLTLTFLEIVLGVDNIIFITIATNKLKKEEQPKARNIGLMLAMAFRIILLFGISFVIGLQDALFHIDFGFFTGGPSGQSIILIIGGIFLLYKSTNEIHHKLESDPAENESDVKKATNTLTNAIIQIALINIVFSFDSILTAIGLTQDVPTMMLAVIISVLVMMLFSGPVGTFVNNHPTVQMLGLAFLILIGFALIAEGAHKAHFSFFGNTIGEVPKGYLYFAIAFSLLVEFLNIKMSKKKQKPVQLHGYAEQAAKEGSLDDNVIQ
jgi:predicted tellurium resistance membrane protein TerC